MNYGCSQHCPCRSWSSVRGTAHHKTRKPKDKTIAKQEINSIQSKRKKKSNGKTVTRQHNPKQTNLTKKQDKIKRKNQEKTKHERKKQEKTRQL